MSSEDRIGPEVPDAGDPESESHAAHPSPTGAEMIGMSNREGGTVKSAHTVADEIAGWLRWKCRSGLGRARSSFGLADVSRQEGRRRGRESAERQGVAEMQLCGLPNKTQHSMTERADRPGHRWE
jgi:hypothetical protein